MVPGARKLREGLTPCLKTPKISPDGCADSLTVGLTELPCRFLNLI